MLGIHDYWLFVLTGVPFNLTPGQDTLFILGRSLSGGLRRRRLCARHIVWLRGSHDGGRGRFGARKRAFTLLRGATYDTQENEE
jgi:hypothetical protein